ncbi:DNA-binding protein [Longimonas halophila]|uniref:DNA-binding protein n=1 Tax=Longimonas halophila TaxID=1469170 RepID=A0A2H3NHX9_9BACT|nr:HEPN domain-containing protein [Longimonas halophila]PEN04732.1 DNA-binding protein [Longimonas halophila]
MTAPDDETQALMRKARQAIEDARLLLDHSRSEAAVNRIYYAAFDAARAALLTKDEAPASHSGVKARFSYHFVRTDQVERKHGRTLAVAEDMRNRADYNAFAVFDTGAAIDLLSDVEQFVEVIADML